MCFSATASFTASAFLLGCGAAAMLLAKPASQRPLAAIPLLFGVQQGIEGFVWLSLDRGHPATAVALGHAYTFFSHILWPAYVPFATWLAERPGTRRTMLGGAAVAGLIVATILAWSLAVDPVTPVAIGGHIEYQSLQLLGPAVMMMYLAATSGSMLASSSRFVRAFGATTVATFAFAYFAYGRWFISVWCFFAAWLSVVLVLRFATLRERQLRAKHAGSGSARWQA